MLELDRHLSRSLEQARHTPLNVQRYGHSWVWVLSSDAWADAARWAALDSSAHPLAALRRALDLQLRPWSEAAMNALPLDAGDARLLQRAALLVVVRISTVRSACTTICAITRPTARSSASTMAPRGRRCSACACCRRARFRCCAAASTKRCPVCRHTCSRRHAYRLRRRLRRHMRSELPADVYRTDTCTADHGAAVSSRMTRAEQWQGRWVVAGLGSRVSA